MTPTRTARSRVTAALATFATVTAVTIPLLATAASAATTAVTVDTASKTANNRTVAYQGNTADNAHTITGTLANDAGGVSTTRFLIVSGPNADLLNNGANAADGTCTNPSPTTFSCSYTNGAGNTGTDTIRVFADVNNNQIFDAGEPSDTATKTWSGAPFSVVMTPPSDTAAQGTCNPFTVVVRDAGGNPAAAGTLVDVTVTQTTPAPTLAAPSDVTFCDTTANGGPGGTNAQAAPAGASNAAIQDGTSTFKVGQRGEFLTDDAGTLTFGITSNNQSAYNVVAFVEDADSDTLTAGEPNDTSTKTFTAGTAAGVSSVDAEPETATRFIGDTHTFTALLKNAGGDTVSGVTPLVDITSGPNAAVTPTCGASNQAGVSSCSYTAGTTTGTDNLIVWVQQNNAGGTPGPDASEPQDAIQATFIAGQASTLVDLTCAGSKAGGTNQTAPAGETAGQKETREETCVNPTSAPTETFTVHVTTDTNGDTVRENAAGVPVNFTVTPTGANAATTAADVTPTSGTVTTGPNGTATFTVTNPSPAANDSYSVTASTATATGTTSDTATKTYQARTTSPTGVTVTPAFDTNQVNTAHTVTATVLDQFGDPIANQAIVFTVTGRNTRTSTGLTTNASGQATFTYTDTGASNANGTDSITATSGAVTSPAATKFWITEPATVGQVDLDVSGACNTTFGDNDTKNVALASTNTVCATVRTASGNNVIAGETVTFTITGVGTFANGTKTTTAVTDAAGQATASATSTASGAQTITATAGGKSDTGTLTYAAPAPSQARFIDLKPDTSDVVAGQNVELTARVTDRFGNPVQGITVDFNENGPGRFSNGTSSISGVTGATGTVTVTFTSDAGTTGTDTVTATINAVSSGVGLNGTECDDAAITGPPAFAAGNCTDTSTYTFKPPAPTSTVPTFIIGTNVIAAGQFTKVVINGTPGDTVQVLVKGAASTTFTVIANLTVNPAGVASWPISPSTSSNYFVRSAAGAAPQKFLLVKAVQSLNVAKSGLTGIFTGLVKPSVAGRVVTVYYYVTGGHVQIACQTRVQVGGKFACNRAGFRSGMLIHAFAQTNADKFNAAGRSGVKDLRF